MKIVGKAFKLMAITAFFFLMMITQALAIGEIFRIETSGTQYCGDYDVVKFNASNNVDLWIHIVSDTEIIVSFTPDFALGTTFSMYGSTYLSGKNKAAFVGGALFVDYSYATIQGTAKLDKSQRVKSMQGTFIQNGLLEYGCFSAGKFKTVQRLQ